jgi:hypothetical protein
MNRISAASLLVIIAWFTLTGQAIDGNQTANNQVNSQPPKLSATAKATPKSTAPAEVGKSCYPGSESGLSCEAIAARAAVIQAKAADEQVAIGWWQFGMGASTLIAAVAAAIFAGTAAHHAKRSADVSQDASRAWVICDDIVLKRRVSIAENPELEQRYHIQADVFLRNVGLGMARNVRVHVDIVSAQTVIFEPAWSGIRQNTVERFETFAMPGRMLAMPIGPNQVVRHEFGWGGPTPDHPSLLEVSGGAFYFIGYLDYYDHFGRLQHARFAFHPDGDSVRPWDMITLVRAGNIGDAT